MRSRRLLRSPNQAARSAVRHLVPVLLASLVWAGTALGDSAATDDAVQERRARAEAWRAAQETLPGGPGSEFRLTEDGQLVPGPVVEGLPPAGPGAAKSFVDAEIGGEDILLEAGPYNGIPRLEITSTGVIYVAILRLPNSWGFPQDINIYRSVDGGRSFTLWSAFDDVTPGDIDFVADFVIAEGASDRAFLVYDTKLPGNRSVRVAWAELTPGTPTWNHVTALSAAGADFGTDIDLETDAGAFADYYLYLAASANDSDGRDIWFTRSTDMGATWETGYRAVNAVSGQEYPLEPSLAYGGGGYLHLAYQFRDPVTGGPKSLQHRRIAGYAAGGSVAWSPATVLDDDTSGNFRALVGVAATASGNTVLVQVNDRDSEVYQGSRLLWSTDNGATWPAANATNIGVEAFSGRPDIDPATGEVWLLGGDYAADPNEIEILTQHTSLADLGAVSEVRRWSAPGAALNASDYEVKHDPSRGGQRAVVWMKLDTSGVEVYFDAEWHRDPGWPNTEAGFPLAVGGTGRTPPAIANVDADPFGEIVFATEEGLIYVVNHDGTIADGWPVDLNETIAWDSPVAVGDLNGDDEPEIVVGTAAGRVFAYHPDGTPVSGWPVELGTGADTFVSIGALGPPYPRYVVACSGHQLRVLRYDGQDVSPAWGTAVGLYTTPAAIGDVDNDGISEIVTHQADYVNVHRLGRNTTVAFRSFFAQQLTGMPSLVDIDQDGDLEIAVGTATGRVHLLQHDLTNYSAAFPYDTGNVSPVMGVVPVNLLGNSAPELVFSQLDGTTHIVFEDGVPGVNYPKSTAANDFVYLPPIVANVHLTSPDVVVSAGTSLYCWENLGAVPDGWPRAMGDLIEESAAAGDIDLDGNLEIVVLGLNELRVLDVGNPPSPNPGWTWPMYGFDAQRTGCLNCVEDAVSGVDDPRVTAPTRLSFAPPFPNPASARTALSYALPAPAQVKLQIFDVRGRLVRTLADGQQEAGHHEVFWNGTHANGRRVALGLYLARLTVAGAGGQEERVRKISLVR